MQHRLDQFRNEVSEMSRRKGKLFFDWDLDDHSGSLKTWMMIREVALILGVRMNFVTPLFLLTAIAIPTYLWLIRRRAKNRVVPFSGGFLVEDKSDFGGGRRRGPCRSKTF